MDFWDTTNTVQLAVAVIVATHAIRSLWRCDMHRPDRHQIEDLTEANEALRETNADLHRRLAAIRPAAPPRPKPTWRTIADARRNGTFDDTTLTFDTRHLHEWLAEHDNDPVIWAAPDAVTAARDTRPHPNALVIEAVMAVAS